MSSLLFARGVPIIVLPWPPTVNTYYRNVVVKRRPRVLISARGRKYRTTVGGLVRLGRLRSFGSQRLSIALQCAPPDARVRDLDNLGKAVLDSLKYAGVYEDDSQIDELTFIRLPPVKRGHVLVHISQISTAAAA